MKTREQKQEDAKVRNEYWQTLSPKEQLADLDRRLGAGVGATAQRKRIQNRIDGDNLKANQPAVPAVLSKSQTKRIAVQKDVVQ